MKAQPTSFATLITGDGSPTLAPLAANGEGLEPMHSLVGALGETREVYGNALMFAESHDLPLRIVVVGMGLGYIELLAIARYASQIEKLVSFELEPSLRDSMLAWVRGQAPAIPAFAQAAECVARAEGILLESLRERAQSLLDEKRWKLREALTPASMLTPDFNLICYDAYSSHSSPELWGEDFLVRFLQQAAAPHCCVATYAAKSTLKRALLATGFAVHKRHGFAGKRERLHGER